MHLIKAVTSLPNISSIVEFIVPEWADKVDFGIEGYCTSLPAVCSLAGRYDNPMPESTLSPPPNQGL
jgi:hypothetical protein